MADASQRVLNTGDMVLVWGRVVQDVGAEVKVEFSASGFSQKCYVSRSCIARCADALAAQNAFVSNVRETGALPPGKVMPV